MKRLLILLLLFGPAISGVFGMQVRVTGQWAIQDEDSKVIHAARQGRADHLAGLGVEIVNEHFGFGGLTVLSFHENQPELLDVKWDARMFVAYHLLDNRKVLDLFVQAGLGASGSGDLNPNPWDGEHSETRATNLALSLYPYVGAGVGLNFLSGFYLSGQFNWKPGFAKAPYTSIPRVADEHPFEVVVSVGYSFGR